MTEYIIPSNQSVKWNMIGKVVFLNYEQNSSTIKIGTTEYTIPSIDQIKEVTEDKWPFEYLTPAL